MKFLFSTWPHATYQGLALTKSGASNRMVSYAFVRQLRPGFLEQYVKEGFVLSDETEALAKMLMPLPKQGDALSEVKEPNDDQTTKTKKLAAAARRRQKKTAAPQQENGR